MQTSDPVHYAVIPFHALCGADAPDQITTQIAENATCADCVGEALKSIEGIAQAWRDVVVPAIENAAAAFVQAGEAVYKMWAEWWESLPPDLRREIMRGSFPPETTSALMAYARNYNSRHPCKKISWRRLNRLQRRAAIEMYASRAR